MTKLRVYAARLGKYLKYLYRAKHYKGHGIHSPYIYEFVTEVLFKKDANSNYLKVKAYKNNLLKNNQVIHIQDYGAGSQQLPSNIGKVKNIAAISSTREKYGKLLSRIMKFYSPQTIIEIGTSFGVGTSYLINSIGEKEQLYTIEGSKEIFEITKQHFDKLGKSNIHLINGLFENELPEVINKLDTIDLVFFDGNHKKEATINYFESCLKKINNNSIFVFDDIHWSNNMEEAWRMIQIHPKTRVCIDLFQFGIVFFRKGLSKQDYNILF